MGHTIAGFGFSLLAVPPLGMALDPKDAVAVASVLLVLNSAMVALGERDHIEWDSARRLLYGALPGLPLGLLLLDIAAVTALRIALGVAILVAVTTMMWGAQLHQGSRTTDLVAGFFCGLLTTSLNTNGPPAVVGLQARKLPPDQFRPTTSAVLGLASLVGAFLFLLAGRMDGDVPWAILVAIPALLVGWAVGQAVCKRVPEDAFRNLIIGLLVLSAIATLIAAFS